MRRHPFDLTSLLAGLVFVGFAAVYLIAAATGTDVDADWTLPVVLIALGAAGLAGGAARAFRRTDAEPARDGGAEPDVPSEPTPEA